MVLFMNPLGKIISGVVLVLSGTAAIVVGAIVTRDGLSEKAFNDAVENGDVKITKF